MPAVAELEAAYKGLSEANGQGDAESMQRILERQAKLLTNLETRFFYLGFMDHLGYWPADADVVQITTELQRRIPLKYAAIVGAPMIYCEYPNLN